MIPCQRHLFDIPDDIAYLNCAYMSPLPRAGVEAGKAAAMRKAHPWSIEAGDFFTEAEAGRAAFATLAGTAARNIAIVPSASYGLAVAARNLRLEPGGGILLLADEFPSNVYVWQRKAKEEGLTVRFVPPPDEGAAGGWTERVLDAISERTALVSLPHCHWTSGASLDLEAIAEACRGRDIRLTLDLSQSMGAMPIDLDRVRPDFAVAVGYKWLLGPYSLSWLYAAPSHHGGLPFEEGWITRKGSEDFSRLVQYQDDYEPGAVRFDMGERANHQLMPIALAGLTLLAAWGVSAIAETIAAKTERIAAAAHDLGLAVLPRAARAPHYLGVKFPGGVPAGLAAKLKEQGIFVSVRGDAVRVTPHVYTTDGDIERFIAALGALLRA